MADVDGATQITVTFDPLIENLTGDTQVTVTFDPLSEPSTANEVFNSTVGSGGGGTVVVRENPKLTRTIP